MRCRRQPTPQAHHPNGVSLYLRDDGSLLVVRDGHCIEMRLSPKMLLQLGMDALQIAAHREPMLMAEIAEVMAGTTLFVATEDAQCATIN